MCESHIGRLCGYVHVFLLKKQTKKHCTCAPLIKQKILHDKNHQVKLIKGTVHPQNYIFFQELFSVSINMPKVNMQPWKQVNLVFMCIMLECGNNISQL